MVKQVRKYLRPGYVVVGEVRLQGCTTYRQTDRQQQVKGRTLDADWHSHKHVLDMKEQARAKALLVSLTRRLKGIASHVVGFGYLTPSENASELVDVLRKVEADCRKFNAKAKHCRVWLDATIFRIKADDERIAAALYRRVAETLQDIAKAMRDADIKKARSCLSRLAGLDHIMPSESAGHLRQVIKHVRESARDAAKQAKKLDAKRLKKCLSWKHGWICNDRLAFVELATQAERDADRKGFTLPMDGSAPPVRPRVVE